MFIKLDDKNKVDDASLKYLYRRSNFKNSYEFEGKASNHLQINHLRNLLKTEMLNSKSK